MSTTPQQLSDQPSDFFQQWQYPMAMKAELGAASYEIVRLGDTYQSGRDRFGCLFYDTKKVVIARRDAMQLVAKATGQTYFVVRRADEQRQAPQARQATAEERERFLGQRPAAARVRQAQQAQPTLEDLLGE